METKVIKYRGRIIAALLFGTLLAFTFWTGVRLFDAYKYAVVGAIFEIAWFPMLAIAFGVPFVSLYFWVRERFKISSVFLYLFLLSAVSVYLIVSHD
ncbi:MAG: hypothetical protein V4581_17335 [Bacteroidota bacterium]